MFKVPNYGSALQAYSTQKVLESLDCQCDVLDYDHNNCEHSRKVGIPIPSLKSHIANLICIKPKHCKAKKLRDFVTRNLNLTSKFITHKQLEERVGTAYDLYVVGSDQVWNTKFNHGDSVFLLDFAQAEKKCISLASSFATAQLDEKFVDTYKKALSKFAHVSVRESNGLSVLKSFGIEDGKVLLDPTLWLSREQWNKLGKQCTKQYGKYILLYFLNYAYEFRPYIYDVLKYYQEKTGYKILVLEGYADMHDNYNLQMEDMTDTTVPEFLHLFANASLVITTSFHGTAFALNYGVPLVSITPNGGDDRQSSLLKQVGMEQCRLRIGQKVEECNPFYDVELEQRRLQSIREESLKWIKNVIKV